MSLPVQCLLSVDFRQQTGVYDGNSSPEEESLFLTERHCFDDLVSGLQSACPCGMTSKAWMLESVVQVCAVCVGLILCLLHCNRRGMSSVYCLVAGVATSKKERGPVLVFLEVII